MACRRLVDLVTSEIGAHRNDGAQRERSTLGELSCAMCSDRGSAAVKFLAQLKTSFRGGCDIRWRDQAWVHFILFNADGL
jgi:hypothetical protein